MPSESVRRRRRERRYAVRTLWFQTYRQRMNDGLEVCRTVGCGRLATTFAHLKPHHMGGRLFPNNVTITCLKCNEGHGDIWVTWMRPLSAEPDYVDKLRRGLKTMNRRVRANLKETGDRHGQGFAAG